MRAVRYAKSPENKRRNEQLVVWKSASAKTGDTSNHFLDKDGNTHVVITRRNSPNNPRDSSMRTSTGSSGRKPDRKRRNITIHRSDGRKYNMFSNNGSFVQKPVQAMPRSAKSTPRAMPRRQINNPWEQVLDEDGNVLRFNRVSREIPPVNSEMPSLMQKAMDHQEVAMLQDELARAEEESLRNKSLLDHAYKTHRSQLASFKSEIRDLRLQVAAADAKKNDHLPKIRAMKDEHERALAEAAQKTRELKEQMHGNYKNIEKENEAKHARLKEEYDLRMVALTEELNEKHTTTRNARQKALRKKHFAELTKLKNNHQTQLEQARVSKVKHGLAIQEIATLKKAVHTHQQIALKESKHRKQLGVQLSKMKGQLLSIASVSAQTKYIKNSTHPRWKEILRLPLHIKSDGNMSKGVVLVLNGLEADNVPKMDDYGESNADPFVRIKLVPGIKSGHVVRVQLWDKDFNSESQLIADGTLQVPSLSAKKAGPLSMSLKCIETLAQKSVPFRCNYKWTMAASASSEPKSCVQNKRKSKSPVRRKLLKKETKTSL